jgi:hypothetical protein
MAGAGGGGNGAGAGAFSGGARPQTAEIIKTFGERCPTVVVNNRQNIADYIVVLDHEGGKGLLRHRNKVAVFDRRSGDSIVSHSTLSLGGSVQEACEAITKHWSEHGTQLRASDVSSSTQAGPKEVLTAAEAKPTERTKVNITSRPDGADIEIDGAFMGNAPSVVELAPGEHSISLKKSGFKPWERKLKVSGGEVKINGALEPAS